MRRIVTAVGLLTLILAVGACGTGGAEAVAVPTRSVTPPPFRARRVTSQVCQEASTAGAVASSSFALQLAVIEQAAAQGRPSAILLAADAIQNRLLTLAGKLSTWAKRPVQAPVRKALAGGAATRRAITASTYSGNQTDLARRADLFGQPDRYRSPAQRVVPNDHPGLRVVGRPSSGAVWAHGPRCRILMCRRTSCAGSRVP